MLVWQAVGLLSVAHLVHTQSALRIIPDYDVNNAHYPFFVEIMYRNYRLCGGTIINTRYILTTGRCLESKGPQEVYTVIGAKSNYERIYETERLIPYNQYDTGRDNYIGLIRTVKAITYYTGHVEAVTLCSRKHDDTEDLAVTYRRISIGYEDQFEFEWHTTRIYNQWWCDLVTKSTTINRWICTDGDNTTDWCFGFNGSPLLVNNRQVGIALYKDTCAQYWPNLFVRVDEYFDWIREQVDNHSVSIQGRCASNSGAGLSSTLFTCIGHLTWMTTWIIIWINDKFL